ncbi:SDR family oxidoreductase [Brucella anthropi]|uniref:SDR family oxidoreductase n=1 Tax=Brucella anthropi TaxID=529 RepID=UPI00178C7FA4|nr:SDR family oxidoreductase [Brucella anthropi]
MSTKKALVVGASGVIGHAVVRLLQQQSDWTVTGISRRGAPAFMVGTPWITADINDPDALKQQSALSDITHVFYAAYAPHPDATEEARINGSMLGNLLAGLKAARAPLERVVLYQGGKVYDLHLGSVPSPTRETQPRHMPPNFYYDLEDVLVAASKENGWSYTLLRPDLVFGAIPGQPLNLAMAIATYAAFCREYQVPFAFPGNQGAYTSISQATDAGLLARASLWAATAPRAANEAYNVANGDYFRWENLWPWLAYQLQLRNAPPLKLKLVEHMRDKAQLWSRLARQHQLVVPNYEEAVGWGFADAIFNAEHDLMYDLTKLRQHGFHDTVRTDEALVETIRDLERLKIVPPLFPR